VNVDGEFKILLVMVFCQRVCLSQAVLGERAHVLREREGEVCGSLGLNAPE